MGREEQVEEREVLDSIFPEEITDLSENSFRVAIALDVPGQEVEDDPQRPTITLTISYPPTYPDAAPDLSISPPVEQSSPRTPHLSFPDDGVHLLALLEPTILDNIGTQMIFTIISVLKEQTEDLISTRISAITDQAEKAAREAEEKENAKFYGEKVTRERFLEWWGRFKDESERKREEDEEKRREDESGGSRRAAGAAAKLASGGKEERKMTGRELWEKGLVGKVDEDADGAAIEELGAPTSGIEAVKIKD